jgi:predicted kinase
VNRDRSATASQLLLIGGPAGVGKTAVAAEVHNQLAAANVRHCWIEGDFLDLAHPSPWRTGLRLAEENLAAVWANYRRAGYRRLIYTNTSAVLAPVTRSLTMALGDEPDVTAVLLTADEATLTARLRDRERGSALSEHVQRSVAMARQLAAEVPADVSRVCTDERSVVDVAGAIICLLDWQDE